jgi:putative holliday junction resolvase
MLTPIKNKPTRILGIDYGMARLGLALSDETKMLASPLETLKAEKKADRTVVKLLEVIQQICESKKCDIEEIVIGLPLMMSGRTGFLADEVKHFVSLLTQATTIPIKTWDERLTTVQAERSLREGNFSRKKRSQHIDAVAAVIILQSYLSSKP